MGSRKGCPMKKSILGLAAIGALLAAPAMAADLRMPVKAPPAPIAPVFSWTGFYIGGNVGGSWGDVPEVFNLPAAPASPLVPGGIAAFSVSNTAHSTSLIGGGQIGFNYQINQIVLGAEADLDWRHNSNDFSCPVVSPTGCVPASASILSLHDEQNWLGTVRGRLGIAFNRVLLYGTGGLAYGNVQHTLNETQLTGIGGTTLASMILSDNTTRTGWAAGVGAEYAITDQWSIGVEWLHVDLGSTTLNNPGVTINTVAFTPSSATFTDRSDIVRGRIDWRFNLGGPVATRY